MRDSWRGRDYGDQNERRGEERKEGGNGYTEEASYQKLGKGGRTWKAENESGGVEDGDVEESEGGAGDDRH